MSNPILLPDCILPESQEEDLERRIVAYLLTRRIAGLRRIEVVAKEGGVTIRGAAKTAEQKKLCLSCCARVAGARRITDEVEVLAE